LLLSLARVSRVEQHEDQVGSVAVSKQGKCPDDRMGYGIPDMKNAFAIYFSNFLSRMERSVIVKQLSTGQAKMFPQ
jgi:hypothetical protein